jgi:membrane-bound lytic murein transglycosylase C
MVRRGVSLIFCLGACLLMSLPAQAQDTFEDFKNQYQSEYQEFKNIYETGLANSMDQYDKFKEAWNKEFKAYKEKMEQTWGSFEERTKKKWVEYKDGGKTKVSVDFETGKGEVAVLVDDEQDVEKAKDEMKEKMVATVNDKGTTMGIEPENLPNPPVSEEPVLEGQVDKRPNETDDEYAERVVNDESVQTKPVQGKDGKDRTVVYFSFELAPDHIQTRASKVADDVNKFSKEYELDPTLVFAIIHTESYFNPTAASAANAYGLMQLVPSSGGRDAYNAAFKEDKIPTQKFLFNPSNNVHLGCAYVDILQSRYLRGVDSDLSRMYLAIAAYNTGAGNVAKAYTGKTSVRGALPEINKRSDQQNFDWLVEHLPYDETKDYLRKVTDRTRLYEKWSGE